jgi:prevent-host-death family protein
MEPTTITATDLRIKTRDLLERVRFKGERFVVENFHRPMVVLISFEDFIRVKEKLIEEQVGNPTDSILKAKTKTVRRKKQLENSRKKVSDIPFVLPKSN